MPEERSEDRVYSRKEGDEPAAPAIPAATVILVRDAEEGLETLMLRRNSKLEFVGGMWVFPGGRVDPEDWEGVSEGDEQAAARRAAIRESREEAGLEVVADAMLPFSHWCPPAITPKRFLTWFFIAPASEGSVEIDGGEIHDHAWMRPADALARRDAHEIELAPPTWVTLHELSAWKKVDEALAGVAARSLEFFTTQIARTDAGMVALWHGDAGYDDKDASKPGARHRLQMTRGDWIYERTV
jgi:8-oxo-dGTP pyrophosphatase MutT (NUDIX family)